MKAEPSKSPTLYLADPESFYGSILESIPKPHWLLSESLLENRLIIRTDDAKAKRDSDPTIDFNVGLLPNGEGLLSPINIGLLLTAKLALVFALSPNGVMTSASKAREFIRNMFWFYRWMKANEIHSLRHLNAAWFKKYCEDIRHCGVAGLVPISERIQTYSQSIRDRKAELPLIPRDGPNRDVFVPAFGKLADLLAIPRMDHLPVKDALALYDLYNVSGYEVLKASQTRTLAKLDGKSDRSGITRGTAEGLLLPWRVLQLMSEAKEIPHDRLTFRPFDQSNSLKKLARSIATKDENRTLNAPAYQTCYLVDAALRWVFDYADDLQIYLNVLERAAINRITSGDKSRYIDWRVVNRRLEKVEVSKFVQGAPAVPNKLFVTEFKVDSRAARYEADRDTFGLRDCIFKLLPVACAIVIATFSARRKEEIESLLDDCIQFDADGEPWLRVYIEKTLRTIRRIPVPVSVQKAVEVLIWLGEKAREQNKTQWLFEFNALGAPVDFNFSTALHEFAKAVGVPPQSDGTNHPFRPHQFRRFFSTVYYNRFRFGNLTALSTFLLHYNPDMTRRYVEESTQGSWMRTQDEIEADRHALEHPSSEFDRVRAQDFREGAKAFMVDRFGAVARGEEQIGGFGGELLKKDLEKLLETSFNEIRIERKGDEQSSLNALLEVFVESRFLEPNANGHSYCKCGQSVLDLNVAACLTEKRAHQNHGPVTKDTKPDQAYAEDLTCGGCAHNVQFEENRTYWEESIREAEAVTAQSTASLQRKAASKRARELRDIRGRCFPDNGAATSRTEEQT